MSQRKTKPQTKKKKRNREVTFADPIEDIRIQSYIDSAFIREQDAEMYRTARRLAKERKVDYVA